MLVPKEIADKVRGSLYCSAGSVFDEVWNWLLEYSGYTVDVTCVFRTDAPTGSRQSDGHYDDCMQNRYYLPIEGSSQYLGCIYRSISELIGNDYC